MQAGGPCRGGTQDKLREALVHHIKRLIGPNIICFHVAHFSSCTRGCSHFITNMSIAHLTSCVLTKTCARVRRGCVCSFRMFRVTQLSQIIHSVLRGAVMMMSARFFFSFSLLLPSGNAYGPTDPNPTHTLTHR